MAIIDESGAVVEQPNYDDGYTEQESMEVHHTYHETSPEKGHWVTIAEFPETGGKQVDWVVDEPGKGFWEHRDSEGRTVDFYDGGDDASWDTQCDNVTLFWFERYHKFTPEQAEQAANERGAAEHEAQVVAQVRALSTMMVQTLSLTDDQIVQFSALYPEWSGDGVEYHVGDIRNCGRHLHRCVQDHTSQPDWDPDSATSLWSRIDIAGDEVEVWTQPTGAHDCYNKNDRVHYPTASDPIYVSLIDGNVWSPDSYPAGWRME